MDSKYPEIIIDKDNNSPITGVNKPVTIEEFYDLMHHTHDAADIKNLINSGAGGIDYSGQINTMNEKIQLLTEELNTTKQELQTTKLKLEEAKTQLEDVSTTVNIQALPTEL